MKCLFIFATLLISSLNSFAFSGTITQKFLPEVGNNLSGITYNHDTDSFFLIQNNSGNIFEYKMDFQKPLRILKLKNLIDFDTEDIVYLGNNQYALSTEANQVLVIQILPGQTEIDASELREDVQLMQLPPTQENNKGLEGVCYSPARKVLYAVQEKKPKRIFEWSRPTTTQDVSDPSGLVLREPFDIEKLLKKTMKDLSACLYDDAADQLVLLSHESSRVMKINRQGDVAGTLDLPTVAEQYEGMTWGKNRELLLVSEPNIVVILK